MRGGIEQMASPSHNPEARGAAWRLTFSAGELVRWGAAGAGAGPGSRAAAASLPQQRRVVALAAALGAAMAPLLTTLLQELSQVGHQRSLAATRCR